MKLTGSAKTHEDRDEVCIKSKWKDGQSHQQDQSSPGPGYFSSVASSGQSAPLDREDRSGFVKQSCLPLAAGDSMQMLKPGIDLFGMGCQYEDKGNESCLFSESQSS